MSISNQMKSGIVGAVVGAVLSGAVSIGLFIAEKDTIEKKTIETLSGYFDSVNIDMSYDEVLKTIYEDSKKLENENKALNIELNNLKKQINDDKSITLTLEKASSYADSFDYAKALILLTSIESKTPEIEVLINDYTKKYEMQIIEKVDNLKSNKKFDEALKLLKEALDVLPSNAVFTEKQKEVEKSYPQNMIDVVPAYQSGGNPYREYSSKLTGGEEYFCMGGVKYTNGMTFNADVNIFDEVSWAIYNLNKEYNTIEFIVCHVDGTFNGGTTALQIFYDGMLKEEISLAPDMSPKAISLNVSGVTQLKMQIHSSGGDNPVYGVGNPVIY